LAILAQFMRFYKNTKACAVCRTRRLSVQLSAWLSPPKP